jgi:hypothetical protein
MRPARKRATCPGDRVRVVRLESFSIFHLSVSIRHLEEGGVDSLNGK